MSGKKHINLLAVGFAAIVNFFLFPFYLVFLNGFQVVAAVVVSIITSIIVLRIFYKHILRPPKRLYKGLEIDEEAARKYDIDIDPKSLDEEGK